MTSKPSKDYLSILRPIRVCDHTLKLFRFISTLIVAFTFIWSLVFDDKLPDILYFSYWVIYITLLYFLLLVGHYIYEAWSKRSFSSWFYSFTRIIGELTFSFNFLVIIFYWVWLFPGDNYTHSHANVLIFTLFLHAIVPILVFVDQIISLIEYRKIHYIYVFATLLLYGIILLAYTKSTGTVVYKKFTFDNAFTIIAAIGAWCLSTLGFCIGCLISRIKHRCANNTSQELKVNLLECRINFI